jgi:putative oxidoreductase
MTGGSRSWIARNWVHLPQVPLRIGVGGALLYHSAPTVLTAEGHANFRTMLGEVGVPFPGLSAWSVGSLELAGGLALIAGAFVVLASMVVSLEILVRISTIYLLGRGFPAPLAGQPPLPDYELNLMYVAGMAALAIAGAGYFSLDWKCRRARAEAGGGPPVDRAAVGGVRSAGQPREGTHV